MKTLLPSLVGNYPTRTAPPDSPLSLKLLMSIDVIICDVDGCLAAEDGGEFDLESLGELAAINRRARDQGGGTVLTVCTGRPLPFAEAMCRVLSNQATPCVAENGAWLWDPVTNGYLRDPDITAEHLEAVHSASVLLYQQYAEQGVTQQPGKTASVTLFHPDPNFLVDIMPDVRRMLDERGWPFRVSMTWNYINCDLQHVSKASGLRRFFAATGYDPARSIGLGDTESDVPIAKAVSWFGCPANASDEIRQHADYISPHEQIRGVLDILQHAPKSD